MARAKEMFKMGERESAPPILPPQQISQYVDEGEMNGEERGVSRYC